MKETSSDPHRRTGKWRWALRIVLGLILLFIVLYLVVLVTGNIMYSNAVARVKKDGDTLKLAELAPPPLDDDENAALALEAADQILRTKQDILVKMRSRFSEIRNKKEEPTQEDLDLFRKALKECHLAMAILESASPLEHARYNTDYDIHPSFKVAIPNYLSLQQLARLLQARAMLSLSEGRIADAYADGWLTLRLGDWIAEEHPSLIASLVGLAITGFGADILQNAMDVAPPSQEMADRIVNEAKRFQTSDFPAKALKCERATVGDVFFDREEIREAVKSMKMSIFSRIVLETPFAEPYLKMRSATYINKVTDVIATCSAPSYQQPELTQSETYMENLGDSPSAQRFVVRRDALRARLDMLEIAFALENYRKVHGSYPATLEAVKMNDKVDPFSGKAYVYRPDDDTYTLYSVSGNRVDDGGKPFTGEPTRANHFGMSEGDLVWGKL